MAANGLAACVKAVGGNFKFHLNSALIALALHLARRAAQDRDLLQ